MIHVPRTYLIKEINCLECVGLRCHSCHQSAVCWDTFRRCLPEEPCAPDCPLAKHGNISACFPVLGGKWSPCAWQACCRSRKHPSTNYSFNPTQSSLPSAVRIRWQSPHCSAWMWDRGLGETPARSFVHSLRLCSLIYKFKLNLKPVILLDNSLTTGRLI